MDFLTVVASLICFCVLLVIVVWWRRKFNDYQRRELQNYLKNRRPKPGSAVVQPYEIPTNSLLNLAIERLMKLDLEAGRDRQILSEIILPYLQQAKENVEQDLLVPHATKKDIEKLKGELLGNSGVLAVFIILVYWFLWLLR